MIGRRLYGLSLRAFPRAFRERYGRDMEVVFGDRLSEAGGVLGRGVVVVRGILDVLVQAAAEWRADVRVRRADGFVVEEGRAWPGSTGALASDAMHALRALRRSPGFALVALQTLALGIGATTAVFSVVNALLLRPLPYAEADRLVAVWPSANSNKMMVHRVVESVPALESVSGISIWTVTVSGDASAPEEVEVALVSPDHFRILGTAPVLGRSFRPDEGRIGANGVLILSDEYWRSRFGSDPGIIGRTVRMSGAGHLDRTVIGVMPPGFRPVVPGKLAGWVPLEDSTGVTFATDPTWYVNWRVGRLAPGTTRQQANDQLRALAAKLHEEAPQNIDDEDVRAAVVEPLRENRVGEIGRTLWLLLGAVTLVLLISCANVANLLLARGEARLREVAVRRALGARGRRIAGQLLTESAVLALAGGTLGVGIAYGILRVIVARAPTDLPDAASISIDATVLAFALVASLLASLLFGMAPVVRARGATAADALRQGMRGGVGAPRRNAISNLLVGAEVGLAVLLVVGAGLMVRTLGRLQSVDPGFQAEGLLAFRVSPPSFRYADAPAIRSFYARLRERITAIPAVQSVAGIQLLPVTNGEWGFPLFIDGHPLPEGAPAPQVNFRVVTPGYFETMRIPRVAGRTIQPSDGHGGRAVAVINRAMADELFPGEDPIGRTVHMFSARGMAYSIVGVSGDVHQHSLDAKPRPEIYVSHDQIDWEVSLWLVVRTRTADPMTLAPFIRDAVRETDADAPIAGLATMSSVIGDSAQTARFLAFLLASFGILALLLGAIGVYGVTAYTMARRLPEFGVRLALGASRRDVLRTATVRALLPVFGGLACGLACAFFAARLLQRVLFGVQPRDPLTFIGAPLILAIAGIVAAVVPALRASRVDPVHVMRAD